METKIILKQCRWCGELYEENIQMCKKCKCEWFIVYYENKDKDTNTNQKEN